MPQKILYTSETSAPPRDTCSNPSTRRTSIRFAGCKYCSNIDQTSAPGHLSTSMLPKVIPAICGHSAPGILWNCGSRKLRYAFLRKEKKKRVSLPNWAISLDPFCTLLPTLRGRSSFTRFSGTCFSICPRSRWESGRFCFGQFTPCSICLCFNLRDFLALPAWGPREFSKQTAQNICNTGECTTTQGYVNLGPGWWTPRRAFRGSAGSPWEFCFVCVCVFACF